MDGRILKHIQILNWLLIGAISSAAWMGLSETIGKGVLIGGVIAAGSFSWMKRDLNRLFGGPIAEIKRRYYIRYYFRLTMLVLLLFWLVKHYQVHILGLLAGLSVVLISIMVVMAGKAKEFILR